MFSGRASTKDLFTTNPGQLLGNRFDQDESSQGNSQFPNSQIEFSQISSQENYHGSSGNSQPSEGTGSSKLYQRYMNYGPLFNRNKEDSQSKGQSHNSTKLSYQQQLQLNKARAKERDEKEVLHIILNSMKDCTAQASEAVSTVNEQVDKSVAAQQELLHKLLKSMEELLIKHTSQISSMLKEKESNLKKLSNFTEELNKRDALIEELRAQVEQYKQQDHTELINHIDELYSKQQGQTQDLVHAVQGWFKQDQQKRETYQMEQQQDMEQHTKAIENLHETQEKAMTHLGRKLEQDLRCQAEFVQENSKEHLEAIERILMTMQRKHRQEMYQLLNEQLDQKIADTSDRQLKIISEKQQEMLDLQKQHLGELQNLAVKQIQMSGEQQRSELKCVVTKLTEGNREKEMTKNLSSSDWFQRQMQELQEKHEKDINKIMAQKPCSQVLSNSETKVDIPSSKQRQFVKQCDSMLHHKQYSGNGPATPGLSIHSGGTQHMPPTPPVHTGRNVSLYMPSSEAYNGCYKYNNEDQSSNRRSRPSDDSSSNIQLQYTEPVSSFFPSYSRADENIDFRNNRKDSDFSMHKGNGNGRRTNSYSKLISPLSANTRKWSAKELFSKAKPSPVATVHPQVHLNCSDTPDHRTNAENNHNLEDEGVSQDESYMGVNDPPNDDDNAENQGQDPPPKKRKRKSRGKTKKRSHGTVSQGSSQTSNRSQAVLQPRVLRSGLVVQDNTEHVSSERARRAKQKSKAPDSALHKRCQRTKPESPLNQLQETFPERSLRNKKLIVENQPSVMGSHRTRNGDGIDVFSYDECNANYVDDQLSKSYQMPSRQQTQNHWKSALQMSKSQTPPWLTQRAREREERHSLILHSSYSDIDQSDNLTASSQESSPSMEVTEMIIRRRVKQGAKMTTPQSDTKRRDYSRDGWCSRSPLKRPLPGDKNSLFQSWDMESTSKSATKRRLIQDDVCKSKVLAMIRGEN